MPSDEARDRSASPAREPRAKKQKSSGGFKWKEKRRPEEDRSGSGDGALERGYRDRDSYRGRWQRDDERPYESRRDKDSDRDGRYVDNRDGTSDRDSRPRGGDDTDKPPRRPEGVRAGDGAEGPVSNSARGDDTLTKGKKTKKKKDNSSTQTQPKKAPRSVVPAEAMMVVNVNDRLGTKAAIPCLASDTIKTFKAMVAAHIGRQPHEIMLKRQGERPFIDKLTLDDYGVSNGVQLDLELDTGD